MSRKQKFSVAELQEVANEVEDLRGALNSIIDAMQQHQVRVIEIDGAMKASRSIRVMREFIGKAKLGLHEAGVV